jgi:hypothetical protein
LAGEWLIDSNRSIGYQIEDDEHLMGRGFWAKAALFPRFAWHRFGIANQD